MTLKEYLHICIITFALKTTLLRYKFKFSMLTTAIPNPGYFAL